MDLPTFKKIPTVINYAKKRLSCTNRKKNYSIKTVGIENHSIKKICLEGKNRLSNQLFHNHLCYFIFGGENIKKNSSRSIRWLAWIQPPFCFTVIISYTNKLKNVLYDDSTAVQWCSLNQKTSLVNIVKLT